MSKTKPRIGLLPEQFQNGVVSSCSALRLLYPFKHPNITQDFDVETIEDWLSIDSYDVLVLQRFVNFSVSQFQVEKFLSHIQKTGKKLVYDLDDNLLESHPSEHVEKQIKRFRPIVRLLIREADHVLVATSHLANRISHLNPHITVSENALPDKWFKKPKARNRMHNTEVTIGYYGTFSHLRDFMTILEGLRLALIELKGRVRVALCGISEDSRLYETLEGYAPIEVLAPIPHYPAFFEHMQNTVRWDIGLGPLARGDFEDCKSDIKYLEYAAFSYAGVYSDVPAYASVQHGATGLVIDNAPFSWADAIVNLVNSPSQRQELVSKARTVNKGKRVISHTTQKIHRVLEAVLNSNKVTSAVLPEVTVSVCQPPLTPKVMAVEVENQGERVVESIGGAIFEAHLSIYNFACQYVKNKDVLDAGSGSGYGSYRFVIEGAKSVLGVDISAEAIAYCRENYGHPRLTFEQKDLQHLVLEPQSFDFVFTSNSLEHLTDVDQFYYSVVHALRPKGQLFIAVPSICHESELEMHLKNEYHFSNFYYMHWISKTKRFFQDVQCLRHGFKGSEPASFGPESPFEAKDFLIEPVTYQAYEHASSMTLILLATSPRANPLPETEEIKGYPADWDAELVDQALRRLSGEPFEG